MAESIRFNCVGCGEVVTVEARFAGGAGTCRRCGTALTIPRQPPLQSPRTSVVPTTGADSETDYDPLSELAAASSASVRAVPTTTVRTVPAPNTGPNYRARRRWLAAILVLLLGGCILSVLFSSGSKSKAPLANLEAKRAVEKRLRAPSTARAWYSSVVAESSDNRFYVSYVHVEAQNAFGGMVRNAFLVLVTVHDNNHAETLHIVSCSDPPSRGEVMAVTAEMHASWTYPGFNARR